MRTLTHNNVLKSPTSHQARFFGTVCQEECTHAYRKTHYTQSRGCINTNPAGVLCDVNSRLSLRVLATDWIPLGNKQAAAGLSDVLAFNGAHRLTRMLHLGTPLSPKLGLKLLFFGSFFRSLSGNACRT
jgi:hypothetical protein